MYNLMGQSGSKGSITLLFCHIFIGKSVYCDCTWYDEYLGRIYQKWKIWPWFMFLLITQNQFYRKAPHLVMLGHIYIIYFVWLFQTNDPSLLTTPEDTLESHLLAFAAEESRVEGKVVSMETDSKWQTG